MPVYKRMTSQDLLGRMTHGGTQNQNECFNSMIWLRCPKTLFFGKHRVDSAVARAVVQYNEGSAQLAEVMDKLWLAPAQSTISRLQAKDERRVSRADAAATEMAHQKRKVHAQETRHALLEEAAREGPNVYGAGVAQ